MQASRFILAIAFCAVIALDGAPLRAQQSRTRLPRNCHELLRQNSPSPRQTFVEPSVHPSRSRLPSPVQPPTSRNGFASSQMAYEQRGRFVPQHERFATAMHSDTVVVDEFGTQMDGHIFSDEIVGESMMEPSFYGGITSSGCGCDECSNGLDGCADSCCDPCCSTVACFPLSSIELFTGAEAFLNPRFRGVPGRAAEGSFGLQQGINWGFLFPFTNSAAQLGFRATQSNFSGTSFSNESRYQVFATGGIFRRARCGLQIGTVFDYLYDNWYVDMNLYQSRTEISYVWSPQTEFGFLYTGAIGNSVGRARFRDATQGGRILQFNECWAGIDTYRFFLRRRSCLGAEWQLNIGLSDESDAVFGTDVELPFSEHWGAQSSFAYLIPSNNSSPVNSIDEVWNVGISLVWYPGGVARRPMRPDRPLFRVADNGSFMLSRIQPARP